jgi:hypothetical protein
MSPYAALSLVGPGAWHWGGGDRRWPNGDGRGVVTFSALQIGFSERRLHAFARHGRARPDHLSHHNRPIDWTLCLLTEILGSSPRMTTKWDRAPLSDSLDTHGIKPGDDDVKKVRFQP